MTPNRSRLIEYIVAFVLGGAISLISFAVLGLFRGEVPITDVFKILSDGFVIAGVLLLGIGGLTWIANCGTFHMFGYAARTVFSKFIPMGKNATPKMTYYEYKESKKDRKKRFGYLLLSGVFYLSLGVFMVVGYLYA